MASKSCDWWPWSCRNCCIWSKWSQKWERREQEIEVDIEGVKVNKKNERVQESSERITRQMQSSIKYVMPAVARNVQVLGVLTV